MGAGSISVVILFAALPACAGREPLRPLAEVPLRGPVIEVTNHHARDVTVDLWPGPRAARWRLGTVPAMSSATLTLPRSFWDCEARLVLQPSAGEAEEFATPSVVLDRGRVLVLRVQSVLSRSFVFER